MDSEVNKEADPLPNGESDDQNSQNGNRSLQKNIPNSKK